VHFTANHYVSGTEGTYLCKTNGFATKVWSRANHIVSKHDNPTSRTAQPSLDTTNPPQLVTHIHLIKSFENRSIQYKTSTKRSELITRAAPTESTAIQIHPKRRLTVLYSVSVRLSNASPTTKPAAANISTGTNFIIRIFLVESHIMNKHEIWRNINC
jgi:hypothetical protein